MPGAGAGVDHARDRVVPGVLLGARARGVGAVLAGGVGDHAVAGVAAAHARRLHAPVGGEVGRAEAHALHARARRGDLLEVRHALGRLEDRVHEQRPLEPGLRLELGEQPVHVVDVPRPLDLGHHHDLEPVADLAHDLGQVVEHPGALERVDARPQRGVAEVHLAADADQPLARGHLAVHRHGVLEVPEQDVDLRRDLGRLRHHLLVREVEEVDHPRRLDRDLPQRLRRADGEGLEEVSWVAHAATESTWRYDSASH